MAVVSLEKADVGAAVKDLKIIFGQFVWLHHSVMKLLNFFLSRN